MKNKSFRKIITRKIRGYEEWEFQRTVFFNPVFASPLCIEPAGWRLILRGKRRDGIMVIDMNKKMSNSIKELVISSGYLNYLRQKDLND